MSGPGIHPRTLRLQRAWSNDRSKASPFPVHPLRLQFRKPLRQGHNPTYLSFSYSQPLIISWVPTSLPQWLHYLLYVIRVLLSLSSRLIWISLCTIVLYNPTETGTIPIETDPLYAAAMLSSHLLLIWPKP